jgi:hypothetical protein
MNANDTNTNNADADAANNANTNADNAYDANANDADAVNKANSNANANKDNNLSKEVDSFPILSCKECSWFIEKQWIVIRSLIREFGLEREVHYTTFNPPFGIVYEGGLMDILELDLIIYEIIYARKRRVLYLFYVRNFPGGTMTCVRHHWYDILEGPSNDDNKDQEDDNDDNDNCDDDGDGGDVAKMSA